LSIESRFVDRWEIEGIMWLPCCTVTLTSICRTSRASGWGETGGRESNRAVCDRCIWQHFGRGNGCKMHRKASLLQSCVVIVSASEPGSSYRRFALAGRRLGPVSARQTGSRRAGSKNDGRRIIEGLNTKRYVIIDHEIHFRESDSGTFRRFRRG